MFKDMMHSIRWEVIHRLFHLRPERLNVQEIERKRERELEEMSMSSGQEEAGVTVRRQQEKIGRNDPCSCGSGKKYKKCCGS